MIRWLKSVLQGKPPTPHTDAHLNRVSSQVPPFRPPPLATTVVQVTPPFPKYPDTLQGLGPKPETRFGKRYEPVPPMVQATHAAPDVDRRRTAVDTPQSPRAEPMPVFLSGTNDVFWGVNTSSPESSETSSTGESS